MAGTVVLTSHSAPNPSVGRIVLTCTADASDATFPNTTLQSLGLNIEGTLLALQTNPGTPAPTDDYDVTLVDEDGVDRLGGYGANRDASASERENLPNLPWVHYDDTLSLRISGNAVNSAVVVVSLYYSLGVEASTGLSFTGDDLKVIDSTSSGTLTDIAAAVHAEDSAHTTADSGVLSLGVRNDAAEHSLSDRTYDYTPFALSEYGAVYTTLTQGSTSIAHAVGSTAGSSDVGALIMGIRNDTGSGFATVDGQYTPVSVTSTGAVRVALMNEASDGIHAEDAAHSSGDLGMLVLAVRNDAGTGLVGADGDYMPLSVSSTGAIRVEGTTPHDGVDAGFPVKIGGKANSAPPTSVAVSDRVDAWYNLSGAQVGAIGVFNAGSDGQTGAAEPILISGSGRFWGISAFNGATYDRTRNNEAATVLASAARTATTNSSDQTNYNGRGVAVFVDVTSVTATPEVVPLIQAKDPVSGTYSTILAGSPITAAGHTRLTVYPSVASTTNTATAIVPRTWRVSMVHADTDSITYSVGAVTML